MTQSSQSFVSGYGTSGSNLRLCEIGIQARKHLYLSYHRISGLLVSDPSVPSLSGLVDKCRPDLRSAGRLRSAMS